MARCRTLLEVEQDLQRDIDAIRATGRHRSGNMARDRYVAKMRKPSVFRWIPMLPAPVVMILMIVCLGLLLGSFDGSVFIVGAWWGWVFYELFVAPTAFTRPPRLSNRGMKFHGKSASQALHDKHMKRMDERWASCTTEATDES